MARHTTIELDNATIERLKRIGHLHVSTDDPTSSVTLEYVGEDT